MPLCLVFITPPTHKAILFWCAWRGYGLTRLWAPGGKTVRVSGHIWIQNKQHWDWHRSGPSVSTWLMSKVGNKQKAQSGFKERPDGPTTPSPVFLNLLPESAGRVKATQAEVSKINVLSGSKVARQSLIRQPSNLHIWNLFVHSSLWVVWH